MIKCSKVHPQAYVIASIYKYFHFKIVFILTEDHSLVKKKV